MKHLILLTVLLAMLVGLVPVVSADSIAVQIIQPANGSTVARNSRVYVGASYSGQVGVSYLELKVNGKQLCYATIQYTTATNCPWDVPAKRNATYRLTAIVTDETGAMANTEIVVTSSR